MENKCAIYPLIKTYFIVDVDISEEFILKVVDSNQDYFNLINSGIIQLSVLKFEHRDNPIVMRTFSEKGFEAATYKVLNDHKLLLDKEIVTSAELYQKNGLHVVQYEENEEGVMIYRMLDDNDLDPVGDGFTLEEAILFADNYALVHDLEYN